MKFKFRTARLSNHSVAFGSTIGILISLVISMLMMTGMTSLLISGRTGENVVGVSVFAIRAIAVLVGVIIGTSILKEKYVVAAGVISLGYLLLLTGFGIVLYDESFKGFGLSAISAALGGAVGCIFRLKLQNKPLGKKKIRL